MIRINLLPFRAARKKENVRRQVSIFLLSLVLVLIVLGWIHFYLQSKQSKMTENVAEVKKELELYKKKDREMRELRQKLKTLEQRKGVIDGLEAQRFKPVHVLDNLTQKIVPERMWLTRLSLQGNRLQLAGIAVDNNTVADFMDNLESMPAMSNPDIPPAALYGRVQLTSIQRQQVRSVNLKKFDMTAIEKQQPPQKAPTANTRKRK